MNIDDRMTLAGISTIQDSLSVVQPGSSLYGHNSKPVPGSVGVNGEVLTTVPEETEMGSATKPLHARIRRAGGGKFGRGSQVPDVSGVPEGGPETDSSPVPFLPLPVSGMYGELDAGLEDIGGGGFIKPEVKDEVVRNGELSLDMEINELCFRLSSFRLS